MLSILTNKKKTTSYRKVSVLNLKPNDTCFYNGHSAPFTVTEADFSKRGVFFVEIKNPKSGKSYLFTDNTMVLVEAND